MTFMDSLPLVSIITVSYNAKAYIEQAILSVLEQSYKNIEYIIIDGGSTDGTIDIIKKYEDRISKWISEKDRGISDAFNKGLKMASGSLIGMINGDDWYEPSTVEKIVRQIGENDIAYGDLRLFKEGKTDFVLRGNHKFLDREMTINHPTVFVRKRCYEEFGLFDEKYKCAMDYDLMLRFWSNRCSFKYIPEVLANMRWEGLSDKRWLLGCRETLAIKDKYMPNHKRKHLLYFYKHVAAIAIPKFLKKMKLDSVVKGYRSKVSRVKKVYE
ncbi:MAG: glycosyltransferase [Bacteroidetes bacterium]|nr:MAG: glycosyltransferase [Bacteroidota bacterium]